MQQKTKGIERVLSFAKLKGNLQVQNDMCINEHTHYKQNHVIYLKNTNQRLGKFFIYITYQKKDHTSQ